jgi:hypothetical protein
MQKCELVEKCPFFNDLMERMPATANMMKKRYCLSDNSQCARYAVFKAVGREKVPKDLFPNQTEKAQEIIERGKT